LAFYGINYLINWLTQFYYCTIPIPKKRSTLMYECVLRDENSVRNNMQSMDPFGPMWPRCFPTFTVNTHGCGFINQDCREPVRSGSLKRIKKGYPNRTTVSGDTPSTSRLEGILSVLSNVRVEAIMELKIMDVEEKWRISSEVASFVHVYVTRIFLLESAERCVYRASGRNFLFFSFFSKIVKYRKNERKA